MFYELYENLFSPKELHSKSYRVFVLIWFQILVILGLLLFGMLFDICHFNLDFLG
jgi:hypothetical protein